MPSGSKYTDMPLSKFRRNHPRATGTVHKPIKPKPLPPAPEYRPTIREVKEVTHELKHAVLEMRTRFDLSDSHTTLLLTYCDLFERIQIAKTQGTLSEHNPGCQHNAVINFLRRLCNPEHSHPTQHQDPMTTRCQVCSRLYDDAKCWTICPHGPLEFPLHDYCPKCDTVKTLHGPCTHQQEHGQSITAERGFGNTHPEDRVSPKGDVHD